MERQGKENGQVIDFLSYVACTLAGVMFGYVMGVSLNGRPRKNRYHRSFRKRTFNREDSELRALRKMAGLK